MPDNLEEESSSDEFLSEFFPNNKKYKEYSNKNLSNKVNKIINSNSSSNTTST